MTTDVDDWTTVDALADDPSVLAALDREAICAGFRMAASFNSKQCVTSATARHWTRIIRPNVNPHRIGAITSSLIQSGALVDTGETAPANDAANRNRKRPKPIYYVPNLEAVK